MNEDLSGGTRYLSALKSENPKGSGILIQALHFMSGCFSLNPRSASLPEDGVRVTDPEKYRHHAAVVVKVNWRDTPPDSRLLPLTLFKDHLVAVQLGVEAVFGQ
ncbi:hypothetical protein LSP04_14890 [Levilactobacillus spicheri]|uniref:Uncharacterized protein n=1 Tax=Levilactobacillus spicheri TaxID=216463 RepID=A0ABQ0WQZ3_9LACO|nr:hypothetical protein LSP04_14890 [Levilactobacillus spicheri]